MNIAKNYFECALGYEDDHFFERPIALPCGHCSCLECIKKFKENTTLEKVKCRICGKLNSLKNDYSETVIAQSFKESNLKLLINELINQYKHTFRGFKGVFKSSCCI